MIRKRVDWERTQDVCVCALNSAYLAYIHTLSRLMAQFNIDVDSGIIRISQFIYRICPGMSQHTLFIAPITPRCSHNYWKLGFFRNGD
jgi:hypothetical protein